MSEVRLDWYEVLSAANDACVRRVESIRSGTKTTRDFTGEGNWTVDIEAACAERAFAKHIGRYYGSTVNTFKAPDVGRYQVRRAARPSDSLIIRPEDRDDEVFVLVVGSAPVYRVAGWVRGGEGKRDEFRRNPGAGSDRGPAWFVPQSALKPVRRKGDGGE